MELRVKMFLIVCPMLFLAGFVDSIAGGGLLRTEQEPVPGGGE